MFSRDVTAAILVGVSEQSNSSHVGVSSQSSRNWTLLRAHWPREWKRSIKAKELINKHWRSYKANKNIGPSNKMFECSFVHRLASCPTHRHNQIPDKQWKGRTVSHWHKEKQNPNQPVLNKDLGLKWTPHDTLWHLHKAVSRWTCPWGTYYLFSSCDSNKSKITRSTKQHIWLRELHQWSDRCYFCSGSRRKQETLVTRKKHKSE